MEELPLTCAMKQRVGIQYQVNKNIKSNLVNQGKVLLAAYGFIFY